MEALGNTLKKKKNPKRSFLSCSASEEENAASKNLLPILKKFFPPETGPLYHYTPNNKNSYGGGGVRVHFDEPKKPGQDRVKEVTLNLPSANSFREYFFNTSKMSYLRCL